MRAQVSPYAVPNDSPKIRLAAGVFGFSGQNCPSCLSRNCVAMMSSSPAGRLFKVLRRALGGREQMFTRARHRCTWAVFLVPESLTEVGKRLLDFRVVQRLSPFLQNLEPLDRVGSEFSKSAECFLSDVYRAPVVLS